MGTREQIISTSIEMFNNHRATNVSTVHIANAMGISPGNLYYYFKDKKEIIRVIWDEEIASKMDAMFYDPEFGRSESGILQFFIWMATYTHRYRFFYLEISALLGNDPELRRTYVQRAGLIMNHLEKVVDSWVSIGIMKPIADEEKKWLVENCWTMGQLWVTRAELLHISNTFEGLVLDEVWHVYAILKPYFTKISDNRIYKLIRETRIQL